MAFIFKIEFQSNSASVVLELGAGDRKKALFWIFPHIFFLKCYNCFIPS